jgi:hypothetical protein
MYARLLLHVPAQINARKKGENRKSITALKMFCIVSNQNVMS